MVINAIHLRSDLLNKAQLDDKILKWIYDLKVLQRSTGVTCRHGVPKQRKEKPFRTVQPTVCAKPYQPDESVDIHLELNESTQIKSEPLSPSY